MSYKISHTHSNISDLSNYIINNTFLTSNLLKIKKSVKECIFLFAYIFSSSMNLPGFFLCPITPLIMITSYFQMPISFFPYHFHSCFYSYNHSRLHQLPIQHISALFDCPNIHNYIKCPCEYSGFIDSYL